MSTIDVASIVSQLMAVERQPVDLLTARQAVFKKKADALDGLKSLVADIATKVQTFDVPSEWNILKASSSSTAVTTSVTSEGLSGSLTFKVNDLATSQKLYSSATLESTSTKVTTASRLLVAAGGAKLGLSELTGSTDLTVGSHTVEVTQSSSAAVKTGPWPTSKVSIDNTSDQIVLELNGSEYTIALASGTDLDHADVVDNLNTALASAGIGDRLTASLTSTGQLQLATTGEGSTHSLQITGGNALAGLGLAVDATAITGTDAKVKVDGVETTLTDVSLGGTASLSAGPGKGTVDVTFAGGLRTGKLTARQVDLGDGSLSTVVGAINASGGDITASAIKVGDNAYRLQIQSKVSGVSGRMNIDQSIFDGIGSFAVLAAGTDASIELTGDNPITITSSSNSFKDVLPGVSFTLASQPTDPVTVTATRDQDTLASRVQGMLDSVNKVLNDVKAKTKYDSTTNTSGPLSGDFTLSRLQQSLREAVTASVIGGDLTQAGQVGITLSKEGTLSFDKAKFLEAYNDDPAAVQRLFMAPTALDPNPGIGQRLATIVKSATDYTSGTLSTAATSQRNRVTDIDKALDRWEDRLAVREATLIRQFTNLNTALQNLGSQSQWLSGQIAALGSGSMF